MHHVLIVATYIFITIIIYFFFFLLYTNLRRIFKNKLKTFLKAKLYLELLRYKTQKKIKPSKYFWLKSNLGLEVVLEVLNELDKNHVIYLKKILKNVNYKRYMFKVLKTKDTDLLAFNIKLIGELDMRFVEPRIIKILYQKQNNIYLQYNCLITLSKFGNKQTMLKIFNDEQLNIYLTNAALKEVFCAYRGNQVGLYKTLLKTSNPVVLKLCIKLIGLKKYDSLAKDIIPFLDSTNYEVILEAVKTLGQLKENTAFVKIKKLFNQPHVNLKVECLNALANISLARATKTLQKGLNDSDWWIRYNAAMALINHPNFDDIYQEATLINNTDVIKTLKYAKERKKIIDRGDELERNNLRLSAIR